MRWRNLRRFGVIEAPEEGIARRIAAGMKSCGLFYVQNRPAVRSEGQLLVLSPKGGQMEPKQPLCCRYVLLPGTASEAVLRQIKANSAVSYGFSTRDTLTISSLEEDRLSLALQRELVTMEGHVLEQQELCLPRPVGLSPEEILAVCGSLLLLGVAPEQLRL